MHNSPLHSLKCHITAESHSPSGCTNLLPPCCFKNDHIWQSRGSRKHKEYLPVPGGVGKPGMRQWWAGRQCPRRTWPAWGTAAHAMAGWAVPPIHHHTNLRGEEVWAPAD